MRARAATGGGIWPADGVEQVAAALRGVTVLIGDRLGLFIAMADGGWVNATGLAERTGTLPGRVDGWLRCQAGGGYVVHDPSVDAFRLAPERAAAVLDEHPPVAAGFQIVAAAFKDEPVITEAFRTGERAAGFEPHPDLRSGMTRYEGAANPLPEPITASLRCLYGDDPTRPRGGRT